LTLTGASGHVWGQHAVYDRDRDLTTIHGLGPATDLRNKRVVASLRR